MKPICNCFLQFCAANHTLLFPFPPSSLDCAAHLCRRKVDMKYGSGCVLHCAGHRAGSVRPGEAVTRTAPCPPWPCPLSLQPLFYVARSAPPSPRLPSPRLSPRLPAPPLQNIKLSACHRRYPDQWPFNAGVQEQLITFALQPYVCFHSSHAGKKSTKSKHSLKEGLVAAFWLLPAVQLLSIK